MISVKLRNPLNLLQCDVSAFLRQNSDMKLKSRMRLIALRKAANRRRNNEYYTETYPVALRKHTEMKMLRTKKNKTGIRTT